MVGRGVGGYLPRRLSLTRRIGAASLLQVASVRPLRGEEGNDGRYTRRWKLGDQLVDLGWVECFKGADQ